MYVLMMVLSLGLALLVLRAFSFHRGIYNESGIKSISGLRALLASIVAFSHFAHYVYARDHDWIFDKDYFSLICRATFLSTAASLAWRCFL